MGEGTEDGGSLTQWGGQDVTPNWSSRERRPSPVVACSAPSYPWTQGHERSTRIEAGHHARFAGQERAFSLTPSERIEARPRKAPRALTAAERVELMTQLLQDEKARRRDLPDLVFFMLATGVRSGEALAVMWSQVDLDAGTVQITSTLIRVKGEGLLRKGPRARRGSAPWPSR